MRRGVIALGLAVLCVLALVAAGARSRPPERVVCTFAETTEGWVAVPPPSGVPVTLSITDGPPATRSLRATYKLEPKKLAGILRPVSGGVGTGLKVRVKTDTPTTMVVGCVERDGSAYMRTVQTAAGKWQTLEAPFASFTLSDDSKDENGALDLDQIGTLVIADAAGFLPVVASARTVWIDDVDFGAVVRSEAEKRYEPLLQQGPPSSSGGTVTSGVTYVPGKFGRAMLADSPGELGSVNVAPAGRFPGWRWQQGAIEMWLSAPASVASIPDYSGLIAMQQEPFMVGFRGNLMVFVVKGGQIAFMLNGSTERLASTGALDWAPGSWHHLVVTWGPSGMRTYVDGVPRGRNAVKDGPALPSRDLVVGSHAWTILSSRPARMAIDELRVSVRQRTDAEIAAAAQSSAPTQPDRDTLALERFDGSPVAPATTSGGAEPWSTFAPGRAVTLTVRAGAATAATVRRPGGQVLRTAPVVGAGRRLPLGAFREPGFYRVALQPSGGGWFRVARPKSRAAGPLLFGASACYSEAQDAEDYFRRAAAAGVRTLRMPFEWYEIEPDEGRFVWDKYDRIVRWADKHGVELVPTFIWEKPQPSWAGPGEVQTGSSSQRHPPTDMARWQRFVRAVVGRYKATIHWWIPANEPNLPRYWHPKPDAKAYVGLLRSTWEAARSADPTAKMLGVSASGNDLGYLEACFAAGALKYCDAVGIHPYICPHSPDEAIPVNILDPTSKAGTFRDGLRMAGDLIRRYGGHQKLWLDEAGQPYRDDFIAPNWGQPEGRAAETLAKQMVEALSSGVVDRVLWFSFFGGEYGSFALVRPDGSPTLPLIAYCAAGDMLAGAVATGDGSRGSDVTSRLFRRGRTTLEVVWRARGADVLRLARGEKAYDMYGHPLRSSAGGKTALDSRPIYITR